MKKEIREQIQQRKCRCLLSVGFTFFALSTIYVLYILTVTHLDVQAKYPNDSISAVNEFGFLVFVVIGCIVPVLAQELSFIRSTYKMLKHEPEDGVKVCYMISVLLALLMFILPCLVLFGVINFSFLHEHQDNTWDILLLTGWPCFLLSFILGSVPIKHSSNRDKWR